MGKEFAGGRWRQIEKLFWVISYRQSTKFFPSTMEFEWYELK